MKRRAGSLFAAAGIIVLLAASTFANHDAVRLRLNATLRYVTMGWFNEAARHAEETVKLAPQDADAQLLLALLRQVEGEQETALWHYDLAKSLDPDMTVLTALMGDIRLSQGRLEEAIALYKQALAADSDLGLAYYGLGRALELQGDAGARDAYERGVQAAPDLVGLRWHLGRLLRHQAEHQSALEHLLHASQVSPDVVHVRFELGLVYEALGRLSAAEHEYRTALRLDPAHRQARERLAALPSL